MSQPSAPQDLQRWQVLAAGVCALVLTIGLARFAYTPLLPVMREQAGLGPGLGGWLAALNYAGYISGALLAMRVTNAQHKFLAYRAGLVVAVISTAAMGLTQAALPWAIWRYLAGLSSAAGMLLASGLVLDWLIRRAHRPELGLHFAGLGLGIAVSGLGASLMAGHWPWDRQWLAFAALGLALLLPAWRWMPAPGGLHAAAAHAAGRSAPTARWMRAMQAAYFCAGFAYVISATFLVAILEDMPLLRGRGGWIWVMVGLAAAPAAPLWDRIAQRAGAVQALLIAYALQTVAVALPLWSHSLWPNLLGALLYGSTFVGIVSLTLALVGRRVPGHPARAMARYTVSYGVAQILAPALAGQLAAATGRYAGALVVAAALSALALLLLRVALAEDRRAATTPPAQG